MTTVDRALIVVGIAVVCLTVITVTVVRMLPPVRRRIGRLETEVDELRAELAWVAVPQWQPPPPRPVPPRPMPPSQAATQVIPRQPPPPPRPRVDRSAT